MKTATLHFLVDELIYDIEQIAYVEGDILPDKAQHLKHQTQDINAEGNDDRLRRRLDLIMAEITESLLAYTKEAITGDATLTNLMKPSDRYTIRLKLPDDFSETSLNLLTRQIHELAVGRSVADWLAIINPEKSQLYKQRADELATDLKGTINKRTGKLYRKQSPF